MGAEAAGIDNLGQLRFHVKRKGNLEMEKSLMQGKKLSFDRFCWADLVRLGAAALLLTCGWATRSVAQQNGPKTFSSAEDASQALLTAAQNNDEKAMLEILGPDGKQIISSGDEAEDAQDRTNFVQKYQEMHRLMREPDGTTTLYIGAENWPTPIPLKNKGNSWYFDAGAAKQEILYRRIGENELSTIRVCQELETAEKEYHAAQHDEYAQKVFSDEGQHNGLYWKAADGDLQSPIGPLVAAAFVRDDGNSNNQKDAPAPFRGYYFRILTHQEKNGQSGGKVAFVAYPVEYGSSGIMTFLVKEDGVIYQKDLGKKTDELARAIKQSSPRTGWQKTEELQEEASTEQKTNP